MQTRRWVKRFVCSDFDVESTFWRPSLFGCKALLVEPQDVWRFSGKSLRPEVHALTSKREGEREKRAIYDFWYRFGIQRLDVRQCSPQL